jgi:hypothetical protein
MSFSAIELRAFFWRRSCKLGCVVDESRMNHTQPKASTEDASRQFGNKLLFNLEEAGAVLGLSAWTVRDYVKAKKIKRARVPHPFEHGRFLARPILIHVDELKAFAAQCNCQEKDDARVA